MKTSDLIHYSFVGVFAFVIIVTIGSTVVKANPSFFTSTTTATATSTVAYMTPGAATTTLQYDANLGGDAFASNGASLMMQFTGSSTSSTLNASIQYSQDGIDWYAIGMGTDVDNGIGSTSPSVTNATVVTFAFSSSTLSGVIGTTSMQSRIVNIDMPTRYVRAVFSIPPGSLNGAVWAQFIAQKQNR